jgi:hypothetical protein
MPGLVSGARVGSLRSVGDVLREGMAAPWRARESMGVSVRSIRLREGVLLLSKLAGSLDDIGEHLSAAWFRGCGDELQKGLDRKQEFEACRSILHALDNGPGRIPRPLFCTSRRVAGHQANRIIH